MCLVSLAYALIDPAHAEHSTGTSAKAAPRDAVQIPRCCRSSDQGINLCSFGAQQLNTRTCAILTCVHAALPGRWYTLLAYTNTTPVPPQRHGAPCSNRSQVYIRRHAWSSLHTANHTARADNVLSAPPLPHFDTQSYNPLRMIISQYVCTHLFVACRQSNSLDGFLAGYEDRVWLPSFSRARATTAGTLSSCKFVPTCMPCAVDQ